MRIDVFHHTVREPWLDAISAKLDRLLTQGETIMANEAALEAKITQLEVSSAAREARDVAQDAVTAQNITALTTTVAELRAIIEAGNNDPIPQSALDRIDAVIVSLEAADPTAPVVV